MKTLFSRYTGKILSVIRQDGVFGGISKISKATLAVAHPVGSGDILFVSSGVVGNSAQYRVHNVIEELEKHGFKCGFAIQERPGLSSYAKKFKIFVFHQTNYTDQVAQLIKEIKKQKKEIIFETDDLLFEPALVVQQDFFQNANSLMKKSYEKGVGLELLDDPYVKTCTTTTDFLAEKLRTHGKKVFVVPNKLSRKDVLIAKKIISRKSKVESQKSIRIGYFSGAHSHNKDFATITDVLVAVMEKFQNAELFLVGPLDITNALNRFRDRVKHFPYVTRGKHFENVASVDINIAPLEIGSPFCESKSELKFFEAGIVGVPTVATATEPFRLAIEDGVDGFTADGKKEWTQKLEKLITDKKLREEMGEKAREKSLAKYTTEKSDNEEYYAFLRSKL